MYIFCTNTTYNLLYKRISPVAGQKTGTYEYAFAGNYIPNYN